MTTVFAFGISLALNANFTLSIRVVGAGICLYWIAKSVFALTTQISSPWKEMLFLIGLPLYLMSIACILWGGLASLALLGLQLIPQ